MDTLMKLAYFFIELFFQMITFLLIMRFILKFLKMGGIYTAFGAIYKVTDIMVAPFQHFFKDIGEFETATFLLIYLMTLIKITLKMIFAYQFPHGGGIFLWALLEIVPQFINFYVFTFIAQAFLSWFRNENTAFLMELLNRITSPLLSPLRQILPTFRGFDFSPLLMMGILLGFQIVFIEPLLAKAIALSF